MRRSALALIAVLALAGCKTAPEARPFVAPEIVRVPVKTYVALPEEMTLDCPVPAIKGRTVGDVVEVANARKVALEQCNAQLRAIRAAQP